MTKSYNGDLFRFRDIEFMKETENGKLEWIHFEPPTISRIFNNNTDYLNIIKAKHKCVHCGKLFTHYENLKNHIKSHNSLLTYICPIKICGRVFFTEGKFVEHCETIHGTNRKRIRINLQVIPLMDLNLLNSSWGLRLVE